MERTKRRSLLAMAFATIAALAMSAICFTSTAWASTTVSTIDALKTEVANGGEIVLGADMALPATGGQPALEVDSGITVTIDLNGYTISQAYSEAKSSAIIENHGILTIKDSVGGGKITSSATDPDRGEIPGYASNTITNSGTFNLESGTIENTTDGGACYAIDTAWYSNSSAAGPTVNINGGKVFGVASAIRLIGYASEKTNTLTINGGEVAGAKRGIWIHLPASTNEARLVDVNIVGGTVSAGSELAIYSYSFGNAYNGVDIDISGGTFMGAVAVGGGSANNGLGAESVTVTGGIFDTNDFNPEDGCIFTYNSKTEDNIAISGGTFSDLSALDYISDGASIALSGDASGDGHVIDKSVTIDLGGHTYTVSGELVGSANTETSGFQILEGHDVTIKNGTIATSETAYKPVSDGQNDVGGAKVMIQNYSDLTLENVDLVGIAGRTQYGLSCNYGDTILGGVGISGATTGIDLMHWHIDAYRDKAPTMAISNTSDNLISGDIKVYCYPSNNTFEGDAAPSLIITGGKFSSDPSVYVADNRIVKVNRTNDPSEYTVFEKANLTSGYYLDNPAGATAANYYVRSEGNMFEVYYVAPYVPSTPSTPAEPEPVVPVPDASGETVEETTTTTEDGTTVTTEVKADGTVVETVEGADGSVATSASKSETVENADGTETTVTATNSEAVTADGDKVTAESVTRVTENADGSTTATSETSETVENADGSTTFALVTNETTTGADGSVESTTTTETTTVAEDGSATYETVVSEYSLDAEGASIETTTTTTEGASGVVVETTEVIETTAAGEASSEVRASVTVPEGVAASGGATVTIPVTPAGDALVLPEGTVAVNAETGEPIKMSVVTEDGVAVLVDSDVEIEIVEASADFGDVADGHWAEGAVDFTASRDLFRGTSEGSFSPEGGMTRGMLMTVLCRLADGPHEAAEGELWYGPSMEWAVENGISNGEDPEALVTREQMIAMLWNFAGQPASGHDFGRYEDADGVSAWAEDAMSWAVEAGIMRGVGGELVLDAAGDTERAQVAAFLQRFVEYIVTAEQAA